MEWNKKVSTHLLSCKFIQDDFNIDLFKNYFTKEGWETVNKLYAEKLNLSTCPECSEFCISKSKTILCKLCRFSWHIKCYTPKISQYYQNNKTNWACSGCKQAKPKSTQVSQNTQEPLITTTVTVNSDDTTSKKSTLSSSSSSITITRSNKNKKPSLFKNDGKNK